MAKRQDPKGKQTEKIEVEASPEKIEQQLIEGRERGEVSVEDFLAQLSPGRDLKRYWDIIHQLLVEKRVIRNTNLLRYAKQLGSNSRQRENKLNHTRGVLGKFVEWGALSQIRLEGRMFYLCSVSGFYEPEELHRLISVDEVNRIASQVDGTPRTAEELAERLYGERPYNSAYLVAAVLQRFIVSGLIRHSKKEDTYVVTSRGQELGVDAQSLKTLDATALENELFVKQERGGQLPESLSEVADLLRKDIENKTVPVTDLTSETGNNDLTILFIAEILYGSHFTDQDLISWVLSNVDQPTLTLTSGLVQGRFEVKNKAKTRGLVEGSLGMIESQFHSAGMLLEWLERITTSRVCVIQSDDDWRLADDYATLAHLREGKNPWKFGVSWQSFSSEMQRRLENSELRRKVRIQWEIIQAYMYRIGRSLLSTDEVEKRIGVSKSEYRLIIEIMVARKHRFEYPKKYEEIVNVEALYGNIGKRIVSPNPLRLKVAEGKEIRLVHNAGFSDITQYQDVHHHLDSVARHLGFSGQEVPWILADYHQEKFFAQYLMGTWIMNLPGMQNTRPASGLTMTEWSTRILESKERRQSRVRKEPVSPSAPEITFCRDGRIRVRILNHAVKNIIESKRNEGEQVEVAIVGQDFQFGSITNWPELTAKFVDYGLYARKATRLWINGDFIHGDIYPQHNAESRPMRLTTLHSQQTFGFNLLLPLILDAPNLRDLIGWLGNHEWNNIGSKRSGDNPLTFLETGLQGVLMERKRVGTQSQLERAMTVSRIRWANTHNPQGDIINWPFFADTICGFKVAIQHMWQPFASRTPVDDGQKWLKSMARAAKDINLMVGGHYHSIWMAELGDKLIVQGGASASQSGYELARGLMSTVMFTLIEFSNRKGITVEFVPWEFLLKYKFQSPTYAGKDNEFVRPAEGTVEYEQGRMAPYIERMIDNQTRYMKV